MAVGNGYDEQLGKGEKGAERTLEEPGNGGNGQKKLTAAMLEFMNTSIEQGACPSI